MHEIDRSFRAKRMEAAEKHAQTLRRRVVGSLVATLAVALAAGGYVGWRYWPSPPELPPASAEGPGGETAPTAAKPPRPVYVNPIIDLAGDPLIIRLDSGSAADSKLRD